MGIQTTWKYPFLYCMKTRSPKMSAEPIDNCTWHHSSLWITPNPKIPSPTLSQAVSGIANSFSAGYILTNTLGHQSNILLIPFLAVQASVLNLESARWAHIAQPDPVSCSSCHGLSLITIAMHLKSLLFAFSSHQIAWREMWLLISTNFCTIW